jgi:ADP-heptose:LPS heptosyltransferase
MKLLIVKTRALGDSLVASALFRQLRLERPGLEIHFAVPAAWAPLFEGHPELKRVWPIDITRDLKSPLGLWRLARRLRAEGFDAAAALHASPRTAWLLKLAGIHQRAVHFHGHRHRNLFSTVTVPGKGEVKPATQRDADTLRALGFRLAGELHPQVTVAGSAREWAHARVQHLKLQRPLLVLNPGASRPAKCWPQDSFRELARLWMAETQGSVLAVGTVRERFDLPAGVHGEWTLSLPQLAALLSEADVVVGNDSGPKHLAIAVDTPTVTLFGPEDPFEWHPYDRTQHPYFFIEGLPCRRDQLPGFPAWCGLQGPCIDQKHICLTQITPAEVCSRTQSLLSQNP